MIFQQCGMCDQQSFRSACAHAQSDQSLCLSLEYSFSVKLLTEHHLEFLSLKGNCTGWSESSLVKCHIVGNHMSRLKSFSGSESERFFADPISIYSKDRHNSLHAREFPMRLCR